MYLQLCICAYQHALRKAPDLRHAVLLPQCTLRALLYFYLNAVFYLEFLYEGQSSQLN